MKHQYTSLQHLNIVNIMNIKITIKEGDAKPLLIHKNQLSEVEFKKKNSLYQQPQRDKNIPQKEKSANPTTKNSRDEKSMRQTGLRSSGQQQARREAEKKMMEDLDKMSKNQASLDMIHNSNNILQKQNQILYENQKAIHSMVKNSQQKPKVPTKAQNEEIEGVLKNIKREVEQMKKIKEQIEKASKQFTKTMSEANKTGKQVSFQGVPNVAQMNSNLKNLADISKNQIQGLENLQAIKNLQSFNIQGYTQAINGLKKQIVQYQKQSEQIERQLKLRSAKLDQITVAPNFNQQLLAPYEEYLKKKAESIDLHAIKDRIYEKIGHFDYGKFQYDISQIMAQVKGQMKQFDITCKHYRVQVPDIKIDPKQLKNLELKLPSAIDQYKAERGIDFGQAANKKNMTQQQTLSDSRNKKRRTGEAIAIGKQIDARKTKNTKWPQAIRQLNSKPIDLAAQVKFQKTNQPTQKTVLQNNRQNDRKQVERNIKKGKIVKQDEDFEKYLEYRAKEQLQLIYKQKEDRLKKMRNELLQTCKQEPQVFLNLDLKNQIKRETSTQKKRSDQSPKKVLQYKQQIMTRKQPLIIEKQLKPIPGHQGEAIKSIGTQVLKEKLKNILGQANQRRQTHQYNQIPSFGMNQTQSNIPQQPRIENIAQNFLSMINNTLTQVNTQISQTIQNKFQQRSLSKQKRQYQKRSPPKIQIPKLQQFRPPPVFNMQYGNHYTNVNDNYPHLPPPPPAPKAPEQKIVPKNYEHLEIKDSINYGQLEISEDSYRDDFE